MTQEAKPYRTTAVFDENTLPAGLRSAHCTKAGAWGVIRVLKGRLRYVVEETGAETVLTPDQPGVIEPGQLHHVEPLGPVRMQIEFYDHPPQA